MRFERLAALGALGPVFGALAIYALFVWVATPSPTGGMDSTNAILTYIAAAGPILGIIAVHLVFARVLLREDARLRALAADRDR